MGDAAKTPAPHDSNDHRRLAGLNDSNGSNDPSDPSDPSSTVRTIDVPDEAVPETTPGDRTAAVGVLPSDVDALPLHGPYAGWMRRVVAFVLDNAILAALMYLTVGPGLPPSMLPGLENTRVTSGGLPWSGSAWMIGAVLAMALFQACTGATPGKRTVGIVVVNRDSGRPVGLLTTALRWLAHLLDLILFIGYLRPLWEPQRRTFADSLLSTVVVESRSPAPHPWVAPFARPGRPGARVVTAGASVLCLAGALFTFGPTSSTGGSVATVATCDSWDRTERPDAPRFREASFSTTEPGTVTRWGVTYPVPSSDEGSAITLSWDGDLPADADVLLEAVLTSPDGTGRLEYSTPLDTAGTGDGAPPTSPGTVEIPLNDLQGVGSGWTWSAQMRIDGVATPSCGADLPF